MKEDDEKMEQQQQQLSLIPKVIWGRLAWIVNWNRDHKMKKWKWIEKRRAVKRKMEKGRVGKKRNREANDRVLLRRFTLARWWWCHWRVKKLMKMWRVPKKGLFRVNDIHYHGTVWGLGNPTTMSALRRLISIENPQIAFISKTKLKHTEINFVKQKFKFSHMWMWNAWVKVRKGEELWCCYRKMILTHSR